MSITDEVIDKIKDQLDMVEVAGEYIQLIRRGQNYVGLCPFHMEKTPSFTVNSNTNTYKCFGCGAGGDVIEFIRNMEGMDFVDAVKYLADRAHIPLDHSTKKVTTKEWDDFYEMNREAALFFMENLHSNSAALAYLKKRNISLDSVKKFGVGYAADSWNQLYTHLKKKGYKESQIFANGLILRSEKTNNYYDAFRNRLIFPLIDLRNRVVGFGGRILGPEEPKYYNSKDSQIFTKGNLLYGLHIIKEHRNRERILLVEGNIDVVMLHQYGIDYAVAALGTAFTKRQAQLLKRFGKDVYLCLDGDEAGKKATLRDIEILRKEGVSPKVVSIPDAMDPDDFIRKEGKDAFERLLYDSKDAFDFAISFYKSDLDISKREDYIEFIKRIGNHIATIPSEIEQEIYMKDIAKKYGLNEESLKKEFLVQRKRGKEIQDNFTQYTVPKANHRIENLFVNLCITEKVNALEFERGDAGRYLTNKGYKELYRRILDEYEKKEEIELSSFKKTLQKEARIPEPIIQQLRKVENFDAKDFTEAVQDVLVGLKSRSSIGTRRELKAAFDAAVQKGDMDKAMELMEQLDNLSVQKVEEND
ncbi:MAG: DNA primase [Tissierellia bacterium]|nr:DNA primase [Tissierellia bacterium]